MEMILKQINTAATAESESVKSFWVHYSKELLLLILFVVISFAVLAQYPTMFLIDNISSLDKVSSDVSKKIVLKKSEKINLKNVVSKTMSYSYQGTQLGFYLRDLDFFNSHSKLDVENKILKSLPRSLGKKAKNYVRAVLKISEKHQVDPIWILSVMWTESSFDYSAKSWAGARGLMQIMPETRKFIYKAYKTSGKKLLVESAKFNINEYFPYRVLGKYKKSHTRKLVNIELGVIYLKTLLNSFKNHKHATVAYNMGPGWTRGRLRRNLPVGQKNKYLDKVQAAYKQIVRKI